MFSITFHKRFQPELIIYLANLQKSRKKFSKINKKSDKKLNLKVLDIFPSALSALAVCLGGMSSGIFACLVDIWAAQLSNSLTMEWKKATWRANSVLSPCTSLHSTQMESSLVNVLEMVIIIVIIAISGQFHKFCLVKPISLQTGCS